MKTLDLFHDWYGVGTLSLYRNGLVKFRFFTSNGGKETYTYPSLEDAKRVLKSLGWDLAD